MNKKLRVFYTSLSFLLVLTILVGFLPSISVQAAQDNEYVDPADRWLSASGRTNELDVNATITNETQYCSVCDKDTTALTYRVPEYTKSGTSALNRGVKYSDGTLIDGNGTGNLDDGTPGVNAYYTGYHWTKAVCQTCGTINAIEGEGVYSFDKNVYGLNSCDHNFFLDFDNTTYEPYNNSYHTTTLKRGEYCQFCKGTFAKATEKRESHDFNETVDGQIGNNRFYVAEHCADCGFETSEYVTAKSVITSYYGTADGDAHTLTVSDLSDNGVNTSIRYGNSADKCTMTTAPSYTRPGYYAIYYKITYSYSGESMTENGVSNVWLLEDNQSNQSDNAPEIPHVHDYRYVESVAPSCDNLGFERWQCDGCGRLEKRNYTPATGHSYESVTIREANCKQGGLVLTLCKNCGDFHEETTPKGNHDYEITTHNPTCRQVGYKDHTCKNCGDTYITDITPLISHAYESITKAPTCTDKGYTTRICTMCNESYVTDYTEPTGHAWDEGRTVTNSTCESEGVIEYHCNHCNEKMIQAESATGHSPGAAATCTEPQICNICNAILALPTGHTYTEAVTAPTCTAMGFSVFTCSACGDSYEGNYTDKQPHTYTETVTAPTCTTMGFSTFSCSSCGDTYEGAYTDRLPHSYTQAVTAPTCSAMGFTVYTCSACGDTYKGDYTDMTEHNYNKQTIPPTCTEHGYTVYKCPDCGKEFIGDYTECEKHSYTATVTPANCTAMGYTTYVCDSCGDSYVSDYTDKLPHPYTETVTAPTCTSLGYTTFTCSVCGDSYKDNYTDKLPHEYISTVINPTCTDLGYTIFECTNCDDTHKGNFIEALGHSPTEWIIDTPATIEQAGEKHIECTTCGEVLKTAAIPQLIDKDNSDEDGKAEVGAFSLILTDESGKPVFNSEITIDANDNISIILPTGRLLDFNDRTTITAFYTDTQAPAVNLNIFIQDGNGNRATGATDDNGQLTVPNDKSNTGDDNGTIGGGDEENKYTYVVTVTDKANVIIENCNISIGESNDIVVYLPQGLILTQDSPAIITVKDQNGQPQKDITVIVIGDRDYIEKGVTDINGQVTVPPVNSGYTDDNGRVTVKGYIVTVENEAAKIANALVTLNEDNSLSVLLPAESLIDYHNRVTVTVTTTEGAPVPALPVTVLDVAEKTSGGNTDENGKMTVPSINEDYTDSEGNAVVNGLHVLVTDEKKPIENAFITISEDGKISVRLPETSSIHIENRVTVTVTDGENQPIQDMSVTVTDTTEKSETDLTDENGKITVPPTNIDYTDKDGTAQVNDLLVIVSNETELIEKAFVTLNTVQGEPDESGNVTESKDISVLLPESILIDYANRVTVTVLNKADNTPVKDIPVMVKEAEIKTEPEAGETTEKPPVREPKTASGITDENGKMTVPSLNTDYTDKDGNAQVNDYTVIVEDTKGKTENAYIEIKDGKINVKLPDTHTLTPSNQTTVTVLDKEGNGVQGISVTVKDKTAEKTATTNTNGKITVPVKTSGGSSGGGGGGGGGGSYISTPTVTITITDKDNKPVTGFSKSTDSKGNITITLPTGKSLDTDNWYTITVTDSKGAKENIAITLKDKNKNEASGTTDKNGTVILPATEHKAYIVGYPDGTFLPDGDMTRAEAAAIFARLISERKGESISGKPTFSDTSTKEWYAEYVGYLEKYKIINGYPDKAFKPNEHITRAEFVAISVRYYALFEEVKAVSNTVKYSDLKSDYWAMKDISFAHAKKWLNGYADGTFKGDNNITRAEVVTIVNRVLGRKADESYINKNLSMLNKFTDLKNNSHWAYYEIYEAANTHMSVIAVDNELWIK